MFRISVYEDQIISNPVLETVELAVCGDAKMMIARRAID